MDGRAKLDTSMNNEFMDFGVSRCYILFTLPCPLECEEKYELRTQNIHCNLHDHAFALSMPECCYLGGQSLADDDFALQWLVCSMVLCWLIDMFPAAL